MPNPARRFWNRIAPITLGILKWLGLGVITLALLAAAALAGLWWRHWDLQVGQPSASTCNNCHTMDAYVDSTGEQDLLVQHHTVRGITCVDCHPRSLEQQAIESLAQLRGDYADPLRKLKVEREACLACHEHGSYQQIAWMTTDLGVTDDQAGGAWANPHQNHFPKLECNLCHNLHRDSENYCGECHQYAWQVP